MVVVVVLVVVVVVLVVVFVVVVGLTVISESEQDTSFKMLIIMSFVIINFIFEFKLEFKKTKLYSFSK